MWEPHTVGFNFGQDRMVSSGNVEFALKASDIDQENPFKKAHGFEKSNLSIEELLKITYWWSVDLTQKQ